MPFVEAVTDEDFGGGGALVDLAHVQLDALREIANIGAGHAATALSQMTGRVVAIGVPMVSLASRSAVAERIGEGVPVLLVRIRSEGSFEGGVVVALTEPSAHRLTDLLLGRTTVGHGWLDSLASSALTEMGNVLGASYLNVLAELTGWTIPISTPRLIYARAGWALSFMCSDRARASVALCLDTRFSVGEEAEAVHGHVLLYPRSETLPQLLEAIGLAA